MTNKNPEACRKWYGRMKQNPEKLQAYRERKRIYMRNYRNHGKTPRQNQEPTRQQEDKQREHIRLSKLDEMDSKPAPQAVENA